MARPDFGVIRQAEKLLPDAALQVGVVGAGQVVAPDAAVKQGIPADAVAFPAESYLARTMSGRMAHFHAVPANVESLAVLQPDLRLWRDFRRRYAPVDAHLTQARQSRLVCRMQGNRRAGSLGKLRAAVAMVEVGVGQQQQVHLPALPANEVENFFRRDAGVHDHTAFERGGRKHKHVVAQRADGEVGEVEHAGIIGARGYNPVVARIDPLSRTGAVRRVQAARRGENAARRGSAATLGGPDAAALVEAIDAAGAELSRDPTGGVLERYRKAVRDFLDLALAEGMQLSTESSFGLRSRVFSTITKVDGKLAELADAVLGRQQDVLRVREIVEQIKGLVVDLYR